MAKDPKDGMTKPEVFHLLQIKYALKLEMKGLRHSQGSVYAYVKRMYGFTGNKESVYRQFVDRFQFGPTTGRVRWRSTQ